MTLSPAELAIHPGLGPDFLLARPAGPAGPVIFASPHSGTVYPADLLDASALAPLTLRRSEDAHVDALFAFAPELGAPLLCARYARAYIDVNREPWELDPSMFADPLPGHVRRTSERLAAGLGTIPRVVGAGIDIYSRKLTFAEAQARLARAYRPYHEALEVLLAEAVRHHGHAVLFDCHSMPSAALPARAGRPDVVLGDCRGAACHGDLVRLVRAVLEADGFRVALNQPYAGGHTTAHYGSPVTHRHVLQIEIDRSLYMDEQSLEPTAGFVALQSRLRQVMEQTLAALPDLPLGAASRLAAE